MIRFGIQSLNRGDSVDVVEIVCSFWPWVCIMSERYGSFEYRRRLLCEERRDGGIFVNCLGVIGIEGLWWL